MTAGEVLCYNTPVADEHLGVAQLVARYLGVVEAARSNRVTQTIGNNRINGKSGEQTHDLPFSVM